ncbi:hypothetical protein PV11_09773 [Exophiala sideris]|uniref:Zn(2)-C6 fungal-type domain-containing protein n=1 Tax=Exophiala sideris TaxID=1016849 RepID=A0A0D1VPL5_9EURO|nr:hypothetical protein PV11_09773 [Exophiala sideris]
MDSGNSPPSLMQPHPYMSCSPPTVHFCSICDKPFTNEQSHNRHFRYCGSRQRNRPRSCRACNAAKTKCSFGVPCSRCTKKGIDCTYDISALTTRRGTTSRRASRSSPTHSSFHLDDSTWSTLDLTFTNDTTTGDFQPRFTSGDGSLSFDTAPQRPALDEFLAIDGLLAFDETVPTQQPNLTEVTIAPYESLDVQSQSWCGWMRRGVALLGLTENTLLPSKQNHAAICQPERPFAHYNANLVIQALRSFPAMMLRRETFPWYIHQQSQMLSVSSPAALPEALSNCMSIAQMFALRTPETKPFLWQTIRAQYRRWRDEMYQMSQYELLAAAQACMIYLIMCIIDPSPGSEENSPGLLLTIHDMYLLFKTTSCGTVADGALRGISASWKEWIFDESRLRLAHLWFLIGCVVCIKTGNIYDRSQSYRSLQLPSPKCVWEANTEAAWGMERDATRTCQMSGLATLGNLIDAQKSADESLNAKKLDEWNAGADKLGSLLNLVGAVV